MRIEETADLGALASALRAGDLPTDDLGGADQCFWRFAAEGGGTVGYAGLEGSGPDALLRSVVVDASARGNGHGRRIVEAIACEAARRRIERLWLLTVTAAGFFEKAGFTRAPRESAPPAIAKTAEFVSLCPITAVCMVRALR